MRPSGAGKTALLNCIMGKTRASAGRVLVNGADVDVARYRKVIGCVPSTRAPPGKFPRPLTSVALPLCARFVPQDDILHRALTASEIVGYAARTRLPRSWSDSTAARCVTTPPPTPTR